MSGGNGKDHDENGHSYGGASPVEAELGRVWMRTMVLERDVAAIVAEKRECSERVCERLGELGSEIARLGDIVTKCHHAQEDLRLDVQMLATFLQKQGSNK